MLTDEKRKKLLAGALAVVMLTGVAGCGNDKDSEWKNDNSAQNNQDEKKDEDNGGGFFHGFFPWYFIGRTFGVGPMAGVRTAPAANAKQDNTAAGSATARDSSNAAKGASVQQGTAGSTQSSKLGSTGTTGKSGIGSGMSRSSGSAIS
ncbi:hypothetical protein [Phascolarctobacterium succinatutens]|uniref:hypothetical protein n=1 Tax=Phascolarctobacterium succinatutens TaxID=626940 RepID=UPI0026EA7185|nr:hypothetical protein [Phascolarctobacterium succinatutens]